ncbi:hypothetical protein M8818_003038 [Zalaria obscura]|uniref:Uncharacterized protein n=1 Tax=Zalaria obscura TaxID=2024903 RepID=A0ACC3SGF6_9PEZI
MGKAHQVQCLPERKHPTPLLAHQCSGTYPPVKALLLCPDPCGTHFRLPTIVPLQHVGAPLFPVCNRLRGTNSEHTGEKPRRIFSDRNLHSNSAVVHHQFEGPSIRVLQGCILHIFHVLDHNSRRRDNFRDSEPLTHRRLKELICTDPVRDIVCE